MSRILYVIACAALAAIILGGAAQAQQQPEQPKPPPFATTKVEGTDNVYVFRYANHDCAAPEVDCFGNSIEAPLDCRRPEFASRCRTGSRSSRHLMALAGVWTDFLESSVVASSTAVMKLLANDVDRGLSGHRLGWP